MLLANKVVSDAIANSETFPDSVRKCPTGFSDHIYSDPRSTSPPRSLRFWPASVPPSQAGVKGSESQPGNDGLVKLPLLLWVHGGAMVFGCHQDVVPWIIPAFRPAGYHIVSISYRFTPHATIADMLEDGLQAYAWCRQTLPSILASSTTPDIGVDLDRYVVAGDSAGGCLATLFGHHLSPPPKAIVDIYGMVDLLDPDFSPFHINPALEPHTPPNRHSIPETLEAVKKAIAQGPTAALSVCPSPSDLQDLDPDILRRAWLAPDLEVDDRHHLQVDMQRYLWGSQELVQVLVGLGLGNKNRGPEEGQVDEETYVAKVKQYSPLQLLQTKKEYPPAFIIHGTDDTAVNIRQSKAFVRELRAIGGTVGEWYEPGEHCFDRKYTSPESPGWNEAIVPCIDFCLKHTYA